MDLHGYFALTAQFNALFEFLIPQVSGPRKKQIEKVIEKRLPKLRDLAHLTSLNEF